MKFDILEIFKQLCLFTLFSGMDLIFFDILLRFCDVEDAYLLAGMGLGCIFYHFAIKVGMIKYD
ncbi:MAG: hypothetical protein IKK14_05880 [Oscillospiraceae bacterium]|nr:hypothetical protein [Oscillospiraceae bacterium]